MDIPSVPPAHGLQPAVETTSVRASAASIKLADSKWKIINLDENINANVNERANHYLAMLDRWRARPHEAETKSRHIRTPSRSFIELTDAIRKDSEVAKNTLGQILHYEKIDLAQLRQLRIDTFDYVDKGVEAYGTLKAGKTEQDRDHYLEKLTEVYQIKRLIQAADKNKTEKMELFELARSDDLFGDLLALEEGRPIPDFSYHLDLLPEPH